MALITCEMLRESRGCDSECCVPCHRGGEGMQGILLGGTEAAFVCCRVVSWALVSIPKTRNAYECMSESQIKTVFPEWTL